MNFFKDLVKDAAKSAAKNFISGASMALGAKLTTETFLWVKEGGPRRIAERIKKPQMKTITYKVIDQSRIET